MSQNKDSIFPVRPLKFQWTKDIPKYWNAGNAFLTHYWSSFSLVFPIGERFFVDSIRAYANQVTDPTLQKEVKNFIGQEICHYNGHEIFNEFLQSRGMPAQACHDRFFRNTEARKKNLNDPLQRLAITVCLEHVTTMLARDMLSVERDLEQVDPRVRPLFMWHSIEELEHKAVAFDVYRQVGGGYFLRCSQMLIETFHLAAEIGKNFFTLMKADGRLWSAKTWFDLFVYMLGFRHGKIWKDMPDFLMFFIPGFHPRMTDDRELIRKALARFETVYELPKTDRKAG